MDDAETPPDPENWKGDQTRRASLRLRDAEAVATTRRDMFGDGSLVHVLAGTRSEEPGLVDDAPADAQAPGTTYDPNVQQAQPQSDQSHGEPPQDGPPKDEAPQDEPPQEAELQDASQLADGSAEDEQPADVLPAEAGPAPESPSVLDESLDAIIDSFPAEDRAPEGSDAQAASRSLPPLFTAPERGLGPAALHTGQAPVSAIFNTLGAAVEEPAEEAQAGAAASASEPPGPDLPDSDGAAHGQADQDEDGAPETTAPEDGAQEDPAGGAQDLMSPPLPDASDGTPSVEPPVRAPFMEPPLSENAAEEVSHRPTAAGASEWPPFPEPPGAGTGAAASEPSVLPPFIELPATDADTGAAPLSGRGPTMAGASEWPPFPEPPGADVPPAPPGSPPYIELPAAPADGAQHPELPPGAHSAMPYPGAPDGSGFAEPNQAPAAHGVAPQPADDAAADASEEATAKIAAEATATAQALDNLQRLLDQSIPETPPAQSVRSDPALAQPPAGPDTVPVRRPVQRPGEWSRAVAAPRSRRPPLLPLRMPDSDPEAGTSVYLLGFLTGVGLSVVAGLALYFLISAGA